eukprot:1917058-Prymnesium_polylepis.1
MRQQQGVLLQRQSSSGIEGDAYRSAARAFELAHFSAIARRARGALAVDEAGAARAATPLAVGGGVRLAQRAFAFDAQIATIKRLACHTDQSPG